MTVRILLVDDHQIVRQGLRQLIEAQLDWTVCGEAGDGRAAIDLADTLKPDVVVMDIGLPRLNGVEATIQIRARQPDIKVVALSVHTDAAFVGRMMRAGAHGYVPKASAYEELVTAVQSVVHGKMYVSPVVTGFVVDEFILDENQRKQEGIDALTPTERMVLQLIASGMQTKEIAADLAISPRTVETHRSSILKKLNASGVADLTRIAIRHGLVDVE